MTFFSTIGSNQHLTFFSGGKLAEMVNVHEAKTHLSRLLDEVHAGSETNRMKSLSVRLPPGELPSKPG
jgi:hypothetical protein